MISYKYWLNFVEKGIFDSEIRPVIRETWELSQRYNLSYSDVYHDDTLCQETLSRIKEQNKKNLQFIDKYMKNISDGINDECEYTIFVTDRQGYVLHVKSNFNDEKAKELGLEAGQCWAIKSRGTTGVGLVLEYEQPYGVKGYEHYQARYHAYMTIAVPIHNTIGEIIYVLSLMLPSYYWPRVMDALLFTAVQGIEREIYHYEYEKKIEKLNFELDKQNRLYEAQTDLLNYIFDHVDDMIFTVDKEKNFVNVNTVARNFFDENEISSLLDLDRKMNVKDAYKKQSCIAKNPISPALEGNITENYCVSFEYKDGETGYFVIDAIPYTDDQKRELAIVIAKDISNYVKLEELKDRYKKKIEELKTIINTISDGVAIINTEGKCVMANPACDEIFDYCNLDSEKCVTAAIELDFEKVTDTDEGGVHEKAKQRPIMDVLEGKEIRNEIYKVSARNQTKFVKISGSPMRDNRGNIEYVVVSFNDVSRIQKQKLKIKEQQQFIKNAMSALGVPIAVINYPEFNFQLVNGIYCEFIEALIGKPVDESQLIGKNVQDIMELSSMEVEAIHQVATERRMSDAKIISYKTSKGDTKHYQIVYTPFINESDEVVHITGVGTDITHQVNAQKETEALAKVKEEYFTIISHELRSPIAVMHSVIQMLMSKHYVSEYSEGTKKLLKKIERNSYRILRMVNNFLDITRAESGFMVINPVALNIVSYTQTLMESILPIAQKKDIDVKFINKCTTMKVTLDAEKYERILLNLLSNAIKYTGSGGKIQILLDEEDEHIRISVRDNGIGIPQEKIDKIFERFYIIDSSLRRKNEGTGIGLSLVKKLVDLMGGKITVRSEEGKGSEFILVLPKTIGENNIVGNNNIMQSGECSPGKIHIEFSDIN